MAEDDDKKPMKYDNYGMWGAGIAIGIGVGTAFGASMDNIGLGLAFGISIGVAFGIAFQQAEFRPKPKDGEDPPKD
jgi:hypothetical protein